MFAQIKFESEKSIKANEVPYKAIHFINGFTFDKKQKWYQEESELGITYEFKACYQNKKYSFEFDSLGQFLDVEKTINLKALNTDHFKSITQSLDEQFSRHKIKKIQVHENRIEQVHNILSGDHIPILHELIINAKTSGNSEKQYEVLIDNKGEILRISEVVERPIDNLSF